MKIFSQRIKKNSTRNKTQKTLGFTLVEVILVLGIAGLMLVGLISTSFSTIARQRYNDTVRGFAEFLRSLYDEAISPQSWGVLNDEGKTATGSSSNKAILGKMAVFGLDGNSNRVYTATLSGSTNIDRITSDGFLSDITYIDDGTPEAKKNATNTAIICSSVNYYDLLWEADLHQANDTSVYTEDSFANKFEGTLIIARTPTSATIHTIFARGVTYDISTEEKCNASNGTFQENLLDQHAGVKQFFAIGKETNMCIKSDNSKVSREITIAADGNNTSAIWLRAADTNEDGNPCE